MAGVSDSDKGENEGEVDNSTDENCNGDMNNNQAKGLKLKCTNKYIEFPS